MDLMVAPVQRRRKVEKMKKNEKIGHGLGFPSAPREASLGERRRRKD